MNEATQKVRKSILTVCNHNVIRSRMAKALLRQKYRGRVVVDSAGINTGTLDPFVFVVLGELGMVVGPHVPKAIDELEETYFDLILAFSQEAYDVIEGSTKLKYGELIYIPAGDPTVVQGSREQILDAYREVRDDIATKLDQYFFDQSD